MNLIDNPKNIHYIILNSFINPNLNKSILGKTFKSKSTVNVYKEHIKLWGGKFK